MPGGPRDATTKVRRDDPHLACASMDPDASSGPACSAQRRNRPLQPHRPDHCALPSKPCVADAQISESTRFVRAVPSAPP
eukprot:527062-Pyramimonas_sp.AAC.1